MRAAVVFALLAACSFRTRDGGSSNSADGSTADTPHVDIDAATDAAIDAAIDAPPDAPPMIDAHACPTGYTTLPGAPATSQYRLFGNLASGTSFGAAKARCESDGTHLVIVETAAEAAAIGTAIQLDPSSPYYWDGITDQVTENTWVTITGGAATYLPWDPGQPNGGRAANCALFDAQGHLYDFDCSGVEGFACECE